MIELPVFLSYRQADGFDLAIKLHESLHGRSVVMPQGSLQLPTTVSVYFDRAAAAVGDWRRFLAKQLERARELLVLCTCGAARDFGEDDVLYYEIRWWLKERSNTPPILIAPLGRKWVPQVLLDRWPNAQLVNIDLQAWTSLSTPQQQKMLDINIQSILSQIRLNAFANTDTANQGVTAPAVESDMLHQPGLFTWEKDRNFRYIGCNDNYARAAGFDSPEAMVGKTDDDMPWRSLADFFRAGDHQVISGKGPPRFHVQEVEIMADGVADILVSENQLIDGRGECVGVIGYFTDITGQQLVPRLVRPEGDGLQLGSEFGNECLAPIEVKVFKGMLRRESAEIIATNIKITRTEVEFHMHSIKRTLHCSTDGDVIATAMRCGIPLTYFGPVTQPGFPGDLQT